MKKDTSYFSHDYNAREDVKILFLRSQLGMEGYGIYWFLIEFLATSGGKLPFKIVPVLAMQMQVTEVKVMAVIQSFELFIMDDNNFFSERLNEHLQLRKTLSDKGKEGVKAKEEKKKFLMIAQSHPITLPESNPASPPYTLPESNPVSKESKVKESKESKENEIKENEKIPHTKIIFKDFPLPTDVGELPEFKINSVIELLKITKNFSVNSAQIVGMWNVFKIQNLTGKKYYADIGDVYSHFINWIRLQTFVTPEVVTKKFKGEENLSALVRQINESESLKNQQANGK